MNTRQLHWRLFPIDHVTNDIFCALFRKNNPFLFYLLMQG